MIDLFYASKHIGPLVIGLLLYRKMKGKGSLHVKLKNLPALNSQLMNGPYFIIHHLCRFENCLTCYFSNSPHLRFDDVTPYQPMHMNT